MSLATKIILKIVLVLLVLLMVTYVIKLYLKKNASYYSDEKKILFKGPAGLGDRLTALVCYEVICDFLGYKLVMYNICNGADRSYDFEKLINFDNITYTDNPEEFPNYIRHFMYLSPYHALQILKPIIPTISITDVSNKYEEIFRNIKPSSIVRSFMCTVNGGYNDLTNVYGIHLRKSDKIIQSVAQPVDLSSTTVSEFEEIISLLLNDIQQIIYNEINPKFLIVSENQSWKLEFIQKMNVFGNNFEIIELMSIDNTSYTGVESIVDFFSLAECKKIFMGIKFSAFTVAAAITGNKPIVVYTNPYESCMYQYNSCLTIEYTNNNIVNNNKHKDEVDLSRCGGSIESNL